MPENDTPSSELEAADSAAPQTVTAADFAPLDQTQKGQPWWVWAGMGALVLAALFVVFVLPGIVEDYELPLERRVDTLSASTPETSRAATTDTGVSPFLEAQRSQQRDSRGKLPQPLVEGGVSQPDRPELGLIRLLEDVLEKRLAGVESSIELIARFCSQRADMRAERLGHVELCREAPRTWSGSRGHMKKKKTFLRIRGRFVYLFRSAREWRALANTGKSSNDLLRASLSLGFLHSTLL